jgi:3'-phosphoadenosine 5'-phosphosulfate sulfotransferase (PAPS reductase)/FAD synthetase
LTDPGWPKLLRVNPILDWKYNHIWSFLREFGLPYCSLYDRGYTSLGTLDNTRPNSMLKYVDATGRDRYKPAYLLDDGAAERKGRGGQCLPDCCGRPAHAIDLGATHATIVYNDPTALSLTMNGVDAEGRGKENETTDSVEPERPLCGGASPKPPKTHCENVNG